MELSVEENTKKLYSIIERNDYDIEPQNITNIYPSGYNESKREIADKIDEDNN
ncbi:MAG: hypothetical protein ACFFA4_11675 [Promethearchaeota archaeon]